MNKFNPPSVLPLLLGTKIVPPTPVPITTIELKPHLFLDKLTGRMAYLPPEPTTPEKAEKPKLATTPEKAKKPKVAPPAGEAVWHYEDPTEHGWYIATRDLARPTDRARYWSGAWSRYVGIATLLKDPERRSMIPKEADDSDYEFVWLRKVEFPA